MLFFSEYQWSGQGIVELEGISRDELQNNVETVLSIKNK